MIETTTDRVEYSGDSSTTAFQFPFWISAATDLRVVLVGTNGVPVVQTLTTHYTIAGVGAAAGGTVTMLTAPATDTYLVIERIVPLKQLLDLRNNAGSFTPESIETALDLIVAMVQRLERLAAGQIEAPDSYTSGTLPAASRDYDGILVKVRDATGPTYYKICVESATADTWAWKDVAVGNLF